MSAPLSGRIVTDIRSFSSWIARTPRSRGISVALTLAQVFLHYRDADVPKPRVERRSHRGRDTLWVPNWTVVTGEAGAMSRAPPGPGGHSRESIVRATNVISPRR